MEALRAAMGRLASLYEAGDFGQLESEAQALLRQYPGTPFLWQVLGVAQTDQGKDGVPALREAVRLQPDNASTLCNLGNALKAIGRLAEAIEVFCHALEINPNDAIALYNLGATYQAAGLLPDACQAYRRALDLQKDFVAALYNLGGVYEDLGELSEAEKCYRDVLLLQSEYESAEYNLGLLLQKAKRWREAEACYRRVLQRHPTAYEASNNLALVLKELNELDAAEQLCRQSLDDCPGNVLLNNTLGLILIERKEFSAAEVLFKALIERKPDFSSAHGNLGQVFFAIERFDDALAEYRQAAALDPGNSIFSCGLGNALLGLGRYSESEKYYRQAMMQAPEKVEPYYGLANACFLLGRYEESRCCFLQLLESFPAKAEHHYGYALLLQRTHRLEDAELEFRAAIALRPGYPLAISGLVTLLMSQLRYREAEEIVDAALKVAPEDVPLLVAAASLRMCQGFPRVAMSHLQHALENDSKNLVVRAHMMFYFGYDSAYSADDILGAAKAFGRLATEKAKPYSSWYCENYPTRLRVGLVSGDIRDHSVGYFLEDFVEHLAALDVDVLAYSTNDEFSALSARVKPYFAVWRSLVGLNDEAAASLIHADGVNVLIDLSGHTAHNRLPVFAWRPAPVQASWLGYCSTTGLAEIDWYIADSVTLPPTCERMFSEKIWRLPDSYLCFSRPNASVEVSPLPALRKGGLTFGSFNNLSKMTDDVVAVWAQLLHSIPGSRLYLKTMQLGDVMLQEHVRARYAVHGIVQEQLILQGPITGKDGHLACYAEVDIGLDPFPYNGVTTTMEALWMGVPVLTLAGERFLARQGAGILTNVGLADWVAESPDALIGKALAWSSKLDELALLRSSLRARLLSSALLDAPGFALRFFDALQGMWQICREGGINCLGVQPLSLNSVIHSDEYEALVELYREGRYPSLEKRIRGLLRQNPDSGQVWKVQGMLLEQQGKDGLVALARACELMPDDAESHNNLGLAYQRRGELEKAESSYLQAISLKPSMFEALNNLAVCFLERGRLPEAERYCRQALDFKPDYPEGWKNLSVILRAMSRGDEADSALQRAKNGNSLGSAMLFSRSVGLSADHGMAVSRPPV